MKNTNTRCTSSGTSSDELCTYMREIERYPIPSAEEERELTERIQKGDRRALERLITSGLRLVVWIARTYNPESLTLMDLIQEGNVALTIAAGRYKGINGARFATYARTYIEAAIRLALSQKDTLIKRNDRSFRYDTIVKRYVRETEQREGRMPSAEEVVEATGVSMADVVTVLYKTCIAKDVEEYDQMDDDEYFDPIEAEKDLRQVAQLLSVLNEDERTVTEYLYGLNNRKCLSRQETADELGIPYSRVRKYSASAMKKMTEKADSIALSEMAERTENEKK